MRFQPSLILLFLLALTSCSRDPNVVKQRYLESGNRYFEKGKIKEATIMYRKALQTDAKYGDAYYRLALANLKMNQMVPAATALRRAVELLPPTRPERRESQIRLAEIYLTYVESYKYDKQLMSDIENTFEDLIKADSNSFDGHRLKGRYNLALAIDAYRRKSNVQTQESLALAIPEFETANRIKPNQPEVVPYLARAMTSSKRFDVAEKLYRDLIAAKKDFMTSYTELYILMMLQNRPQDAEEVYKLAFRNNPKEFGLLINLAQHYYEQRKRDEVVKVLQELKAHAKEYPKAYQAAGDFYFRLGDGAEAVRQYEEGIKSGVGEKETYQKRMIEVFMAQGKREEARKVNDDIREADPKDPDALALQAILLLDKGEIQTAINQLRTVIMRAPDNFVAHYNLGRGLLLKGEVEPARQQFAEAVRLRPNYIAARVALAQVELSRKEYQKALKTAEETLTYDRNNLACRLIRTAANLGLGNRELARQELDQILTAQPANKDALFQAGLLNALDQRFKESEDAYRKCYELNPANARGLMGLVEVVMSQNQPQRALKILDDEIQKYPTRLEFRIAKANVCARAQQYDMAITEYNWLLERLDKKSQMAGDVYLRLGETLRRKGDVAAAIDTLNKAKSILQGNAVVLNTLALMLDGAGRKDEAKVAYEETLRAESDNPIVLNNLAFLIANSPGGDLDLALTYAQRAKQKLPQVPEVADTLGLIYLKKNLADDAIQIFKQCVTQAPNHPTYRYHLGMALHQKGDMIKAKEELKTALNNNPSKDEEKDIRYLLSKIG